MRWVCRWAEPIVEVEPEQIRQAIAHPLTPLNLTGDPRREAASNHATAAIANYYGRWIFCLREDIDVGV